MNVSSRKYWIKFIFIKEYVHTNKINHNISKNYVTRRKGNKSPMYTFTYARSRDIVTWRAHSRGEWRAYVQFIWLFRLRANFAMYFVSVFVLYYQTERRCSLFFQREEILASAADAIALFLAFWASKFYLLWIWKMNLSMKGSSVQIKKLWIV